MAGRVTRGEAVVAVILTRENLARRPYCTLSGVSSSWIGFPLEENLLKANILKTFKDAHIGNHPSWEILFTEILLLCCTLFSAVSRVRSKYAVLIKFTQFLLSTVPSEVTTVCGTAKPACSKLEKSVFQEIFPSAKTGDFSATLSANIIPIPLIYSTLQCHPWPWGSLNNQYQ